MGGLRITDVAFLGQVGGSFTPPDAANLVFWGRAGALAGADGASIGSFTDLSGVGNHATQATAGFKPTLKLNIVNGKSVLRLDGDDSMAWPDLFGAATAGTLVVVIKSANDPSSVLQYCPWYMSNGLIGDAAHPLTGGGGIHESFGTNTQSGNYPAPSAVNAFHIYAAQSRSSELSMRWNGAVFGGVSKNTPGFPAVPKLGINGGGTVWYAGDVAEIFLYKSFLTAAQLQSIHSYLSAQYAISVTPPTTLLTPSDIAGMQNWYKADALSLANNDPIATWADASGNANTLLGTTTTRPLFKTNQYNSLPCVTYDGTDDFLIKTSNVANAAGSAKTAMVVCKCTKNDSAAFGNATSGSQMRMRRAGSNQMNFYTGSSEEVSTGTWNHLVGDLNLFTWTRNAANSTSWMQGPESYVAGGTAGTFNSAYLGLPAGSGLVFGGDICEAVEWNAMLTIAQVARLYYDYFKPKWGLF